MKRRDFSRSMALAAGGALVSSLVPRSARANDSRRESRLIF